MNRKPSFVDSPVVVLTGAGASVPLGKDTTRRFVERCLQNSQNSALLESVLRSTKKRSKAQEVDIEMILDYLVELIGAYDTLKSDEEIGPKITRATGTPSLGSRISALPGLDSSVLSDFVDSPEYLISERRTLREELLGFIVDHYCEVDGHAALNLYKPLFDADIFYTQQIPLFTLNYDFAVEAAVDASDGDYELIDGFPKNKSQRTWSPDIFRDYERSAGHARAVILFKLHGSTTWGRRKNSDVIVPLALAQRRNPDPYEHVIMYPSQAKLGLEGEPFATAYSYLAECLESTRHCLVIGTSFRDREINLIFQNAMRRTSDLRLVVVGPEVDEGHVSKTLRCDKGRVQAIAGRFGEPQVTTQIVSALRRY